MLSETTHSLWFLAIEDYGRRGPLLGLNKLIIILAGSHAISRIAEAERGGRVSRKERISEIFSTLHAVISPVSAC